MKYLVTKSKLDSLADAVAETTLSETPLTIDQMISLLTNISSTPNRILTGTTAPSNSLGNEKDVYFQLSSDEDPIISYTLYSEGTIEQNGIYATSVSQILNNSFYLLAKSKFDTSYNYYYTDQYIVNENTNYIFKTAGNDIGRAALYHADQIGTSENFHIYFIDDNDTNNYIRLTASNNIYFTTDISEATIFELETPSSSSNPAPTAEQFLVKGTNIPNTTSNYYLNSKGTDMGPGFQGSTFTDSYMSFLLADSVSFNKNDPYELDGEKIVIISDYNSERMSLSSQANNNSSLKSDGIDIYVSKTNLLGTNNISLWDVESSGNGTYILKNDNKYLKIERTKLTTTANKTDASKIVFSFASNSSTFAKGKVRFTVLVNGYKWNTPIEAKNNYFSVRSNATNNSATNNTYINEWLYIAFRDSLTDPTFIKKVYFKQNNVWIEKTDLSQFFAYLRLVNLTI